MSRARLVLLSLVAVLSIGAMLASSASAAISFQWFVNGTLLHSGSETAEFDTNNDGKTFTLKGTVATVPVELLSTEVNVQKGAHIIGGVPGTNEEIIEFKGVIADKPAKCAVAGGKVTTSLLKTEIVEGAAEKKGNNEVDILFTPKEGAFATITLANKGTETCPEAGASGEVTGSVLALPLPQKTEVVDQNLVTEANTKEYRNFKNELLKAGLVFAGNAATLTGLTLVLLTSGLKFGPF